MLWQTWDPRSVGAPTRLEGTACFTDVHAPLASCLLGISVLSLGLFCPKYMACSLI